jgi:5-bromo-4-chloroindolyl phosphate hydrolysis protein
MIEFRNVTYKYQWMKRKTSGTSALTLSPDEIEYLRKPLAQKETNIKILQDLTFFQAFGKGSLARL